MTRQRPELLSLAEARRIAIAAQGADRGAGRDGATRSDVRRLVDKLGVLQIDSVNVLTRAHTLPVFARLGVYDRAHLDVLAYGGKQRRLFEYWGHAASLMPVAMQPLFRWRMEHALAGRNLYPGLVRFASAKKALIDEVRREIEQRGPSAVGDFSAHENRKGGWWGWSDAKTALEWLFWTGQVTTATRRATFERIYDLTERVLPASVLAAPTPSEGDAKRALVEHSARVLGLGTEACLRDYYRLSVAATRPAIRDLIDAGILREVEVEGWKARAYLHTASRRPRKVEARALLAPFDPLVWHRNRAESLFGALIRIELYTPKHKRTHGYYVLPFLYGDRVVGRVDLKAERTEETLQVLSAHCEPGVSAEAFAPALASELRLMARWLGLPKIDVRRQGDAAMALQREM